MKKIKVSYIWGHPNYKELLIPKIIKTFFNFEIIWTKPSESDLLFVGPYKKFGKIIKKITNKYSFFQSQFFLNFDRGLSLRKEKPITVFYSRENNRKDYEKADFSITSDFNYENDPLYIRIPVWKDYCDWSEIGLEKSPINTLNAQRFGEHYSLKKLMEPIGTEILKKKARICCFFSKLYFPRVEHINLLKKHFQVCEYGPAFDNQIKSHNHSNFFKKKVMEDFTINYCPENEIFPGWYTEKIPDAFLGKNIPLTWADTNISNDFNNNCFINLNSFNSDELDNLFTELQSNEYLSKFLKEPLLIKNINLEKEIKFCETILKKFI